MCRTYPIHLLDRAGQPEKFLPVIRFFKSSQSLHGCKTIHTQINNVGTGENADIQGRIANDDETRPASMTTKPSNLMGG